MSNTPIESTAIVTVTYNSANQLPAFLESVADSETVSLPVYVVENDSPAKSETAEIAKAHGARFISLPSNLGYGGAVNAAVRELDPAVSFVLISNPDVAFSTGLVSELSAWLAEHPSTGAVGPRILNTDGTTYPSARALPSLRTGVGHAVFSRIWESNPWSRHYRAEGITNDAARHAGWLSGSCLMVRRTAFDAVGGFDESYFMYFEDVDLGYRLGKEGWKNDYLPTTAATHFGAQSTSSDPSRMLHAHHESALRYLNRKYSQPWLAPLRTAIHLGLSVRLKLVLRRGRL
ncbi:N-acetylglucosaminyl-diphospho-decaprenol L-rhamnosyltransferase [Okibacterium sp. HSC-33S16]|uniref:glycosyltransferase family 2 protein n=1 Tax=Okibacterium sp. HSC-33S16 TaxID=2910965 RepID=UPI0020A22D33|nr:glycosyltransferase family 2 protein [Okibacterium sp. HSC-33S16]MCP2031667.1 N-acetylglucosaminyl-diphospho-decaprenol L-rhamnosyltransferase [Okibacterium sp. HSC-33S16]